MRNLFECQLVASGSGFRLAVADDAGDDQVGVVERRAEACDSDSQLAALVDGARRLRRDVARDPPGNENWVNNRFIPASSAETFG